MYGDVTGWVTILGVPLRDGCLGPKLGVSFQLVRLVALDGGGTDGEADDTRGGGATPPIGG